MEILNKKNLSYSNVIRYELNISKCSIEKAKEVMLQQFKKLNCNAICANIISEGITINVIDYAPFGDWGRADENVKHEFKIVK